MLLSVSVSPHEEVEGKGGGSYCLQKWEVPESISLSKRVIKFYLWQF